MKGMIPRPAVAMEPGDSDVAQEALTAAGRAQAAADNARAMVLNRDPRLQTLEQETVTLAGLAADYSAQLSASLDDRQQLHAGLDELETQIQQAELRFATDLYDEQQTRAAVVAQLQASFSGLASRFDAFEPVPGPAGPQGEQGPQGERGPSGGPGAAGAPGERGVQGQPGPKGDTGATGSPGRDGVGVQGPAGVQGQPGPAGPKGDPGTPADVTALGALGTRITTLEGRNLQIEYRDGVPMPAAVVLLGSQTVDVPLTWPTAFPDTNYVIVKPQVETNAVALLGRIDAVVKSKTANGCVVTVTTTATVSAGSATLAVLAYRRG